MTDYNRSVANVPQVSFRRLLSRAALGAVIAGLSVAMTACSHDTTASPSQVTTPPPPNMPPPPPPPTPTVTSGTLAFSATATAGWSSIVVTVDGTVIGTDWG